jgi:pyrroloquinoline-quinone synthase
MALRAHLDEVISRRNLLDHPFYQAWNRGELPVEALATYAREYGAFITRVADGWTAHGDAEIAAEEREHAAIWNSGFAAALGVQIGEPEVAQVQELCRKVDARFSTAAGSLGGLYAFEAQQPHTSGSKLKGLREHYGSLGENAEEYFVIHETDFAEPALLAERISGLDPAGQAEAQAACAEVSEALWDALTGICEKHGIACAQA